MDTISGSGLSVPSTVGDSLPTDGPPPAPDFKLLFESVPGLYLVLDSRYVIVAASDAYLRATMTQRDQIQGRGVFEVFPDNPDDPDATGVSHLRASLDRVRRERVPDTMAVQKYDIQRPQSDGGGFEVRYWSPVNSPVLGPTKALAYIVHRVEDVTEFVRARQLGTEQQQRAAELENRGVQMEADILQRSGELQEMNRQLQTANAKLEQAARLLEERSAREAQLAAIVEACDDAIVSQTLDGRVMTWNSGAERTYGRAADEMIGTGTDALVPSDRRDEMSHLFERIARGERIPSLQTVRLTKDGSPIDVSITVSPIRNAAGDVVGVSTIARDVTEELAVERALREAQDAYRMIFEHANEGMFYTTMDAETVAVNPALARMMGCDSPEALMEHRLALRPLWAAARREELGRRLEAEGAVRDFEMEGRRIDGSEVWFSIDMVVVKDEAGQPAGYQGMMLDITERRAAEEALRRASDEAERANRAKTEFLSRMSHELRTPLTAVLGFGQLLERRQLAPARQAEAVSHILKAGRHLLELIDEVLDIARIEEGRLGLSSEPVRIGDVMEEALTLIRPVAEQRGIAITALGEHADCHVGADRQRLTQVFLNLLSNGVKYNREGGTVTLTCGASDDELTVRVHDEGHGIAPELQSRLFDPFDRLGAEQTGIEGTGLGLALSQRLVEAMGGVLGVDSELGAGSTFWVRLPLVKDPLDQLPMARPVRGIPARPGLVSTILYIEDNLSNLRLVEQVLQRWPRIRLLPAMQGRLGIELARQHRPDLVLLDLNLPDMGGREVLARIRSDPITAAIPVVVLTADATMGLRERLLGSGATAFLTKPFDLDQFFDVLEEILGSTRA